MLPRSDIYREAMDRPTICDILCGECETDEPFCVRQLNISKNVISFGGLFHLHRTSSQYIICYGCVITIRYICNIDSMLSAQQTNLFVFCDGQIISKLTPLFTRGLLQHICMGPCCNA